MAPPDPRPAGAERGAAHTSGRRAMMSRMRRATTTALLCLTLGLAAACGDDDEGDSGSSGSETAAQTETATTPTETTETTDSASQAGEKYPEEVRKTFLDSCASQPGATRSACECALGEVEKTVSFDEFKEADEALREDPNARPPVYEKLQDAVRECTDS